MIWDFCYYNPNREIPDVYKPAGKTKVTNYLRGS